MTELLRANRPDQQNNTSWYPIPEKHGNTEDHTPSQTLILKDLRELQQKEKLNPKDENPRMIWLDRHIAHKNLKTGS